MTAVGFAAKKKKKKVSPLCEKNIMNMSHKYPIAPMAPPPKSRPWSQYSFFLSLPRRKKIPLTLNKGFPTAAWFDLASLDENKLEDETSIMRAVDKLHDTIDEEISRSKVPSTKTILAGFSQGGALAMYAALTYHKRLAAVIVMSSWPVLRHTVPDVSIVIITGKNTFQTKSISFINDKI